MKALVVLFTSLALTIQFGGYAAAQQPQGAQGAPPPTGTRVVEAPIFKVSDSWSYRLAREGSGRDFTVTEVKGDLVTMLNRAGRKFVFTKEGNIVEGFDGGVPQSYDPFIARLQFPLQEGKTWTRPYTNRSRGDLNPFSATLWGRVGGWERISVPAGTFDAIKVELRIRGERRGDRGQDWEEVCWYAQEVKRFVKCSFSGFRKDRDYELVEYHVQ